MRARVALLGVLLVLGGAVGVLLLGGFLWPERPITRSVVDFGAVEAFAPGTVTTFSLRDGDPGPTRLPSDDLHTRQCIKSDATYVHLARLDDGTVVALSATSPHLGEIVPWLPDFEFDGVVGLFRDLCHGETFLMDGTRIYGPAPRDMDWYPVRIERDRILVDLGDLQRGDPGPRSGPGTPARTIEPTALATEPVLNQ